MTEEQINEAAEEYEYTDGTYGFKAGIKWYKQQLENNHEQERKNTISQTSSIE